MSVIVDERDRRVIPRWRDSSVTAALGELGRPLTTGRRVLPASDFMEHKKAAWKSEPSIATAAELVGAALVVGVEQEAADAARFLLQAPTATEAVRFVAHRLLDRTGSFDFPSSSSDSDIPDGPAQIRRLRQRLRDEPRNAILWTDLSREYASVGENEKAERAMTIAVRLVSGNRFVLRSAARLWVHLGDPERSHDLLRRRPATHDDPWLAAAEIAVAQVAGRRSKMLKRGATLLHHADFSPKATTELASALATVEMFEGSSKTARRLFAQSLRSPTDNSLAQATWAERRMRGIIVDEEALDLPRTFEARAWRYFGQREWRESVGACELWLRDEPFSDRPAQLGSYVAIVGVADFRLAERLARSGLRANPFDAGLLNNLIVSLIEQNSLVEAEKLFLSLRRPVADVATEATLLATGGLLAFRRGRLEEGRSLYRAAIEKANLHRLERTRILAEIHLIREEIIANTPGVAQALTAAFIEHGERGDPDVSELLERLRIQHNQQQLANAER